MHGVYFEWVAACSTFDVVGRLPDSVCTRKQEKVCKKRNREKSDEQRVS